MFCRKEKINIPAAAAMNRITTDLVSKCPAEKVSIPCAMILGISMLVLLPSNAMMISSITIPEYGFSKLKIPGLEFLFFAERISGVVIFFAMFYKEIQ
jgi:hypothetical protein